MEAASRAPSRRIEAVAIGLVEGGVVVLHSCIVIGYVGVALAATGGQGLRRFGGESLVAQAENGWA